MPDETPVSPSITDGVDRLALLVEPLRGYAVAGCGLRFCRRPVACFADDDESTGASKVAGVDVCTGGPSCFSDEDPG